MKTIKTLVFPFLLLLASIWSCKKEEIKEEVKPNIPEKLVNIDPTVTYQKISGFGAANRMWGTQSLLPAEAQKAFGTGSDELGLSIFRVRLSSDKAEWPIIIQAVKEANTRGVKVLASPWSPPAAFKSNNSTVRGYLLPEKYTAFKEYINEFIQFMADNGAIIDVVSIQNEPDWKPNYESCDWVADDFINFLKAPGEIVGAKVAGPESLNFNQEFTNTILQDPVASQKLDIVAGHIYGSGLAPFPLAEQQNKEIWMTEYLLNLDTGNAGAAAWSTYTESTKWLESIKMLESVHEAMINNWNAYIWWYLQRYYSFIGDGEQGTTNGAVMRRGVAFSHYAKFIRPGSQRIKTELSANNDLKVTAYINGNQTIIELLNAKTYDINNVTLTGVTAKSVEAYTTTILETQSKVTGDPSKLNFNIPANGITTVVITN